MLVSEGSFGMRLPCLEVRLGSHGDLWEWLAVPLDSVLRLIGLVAIFGGVGGFGDVNSGLWA